VQGLLPTCPRPSSAHRHGYARTQTGRRCAPATAVPIVAHFTPLSALYAVVVLQSLGLARCKCFIIRTDSLPHAVVSQAVGLNLE